jgi:hypothetical protein
VIWRVNVDKIAANRRAATHCPHGHEYTPENTIRRSNGRRRCRACKQHADRRYHRRKRHQPKLSQAETATGNDHNNYRRYGPFIDHDLLMEFITPEIDKVGRGEFSKRCGLGERALFRILRGESRTTLRTADKLLTLGLGRPDLVGLVCPDVESPPGAASSPNRGRTPRKIGGAR